MNTNQTIVKLDNSIESAHEMIDLVVEAVAVNIGKNLEREVEIRTIYEPRLAYLKNKVKKKVSF